MSTDEALRLARQKEMDLVLINPSGEPPVAKIIDWSKFKYEVSKKKRQTKSKSVEVKEMWFKPFIESGDIEHKIAKVISFLQKGDKVKLTVRPRGRVPREKVREALNKVLSGLQEVAETESEPKQEGNNLSVVVKQKK